MRCLINEAQIARKKVLNMMIVDEITATISSNLSPISTGVARSGSGDRAGHIAKSGRQLLMLEKGSEFPSQM